MSIRENDSAKRSQRIGLFDLIQRQDTDLTFARANRVRAKIAPVDFEQYFW